MINKNFCKLNYYQQNLRFILEHFLLFLSRIIFLINHVHFVEFLIKNVFYR